MANLHYQSGRQELDKIDVNITHPEFEAGCNRSNVVSTPLVSAFSTLAPTRDVKPTLKRTVDTALSPPVLPIGTLMNHSEDLASEAVKIRPLATPVVSVIVPAYNVEPYLKHAIDSALRQTVSNIEVIVVDDASKDDTLDVAQACAELDERVKVIPCEVNGGAAVARNHALEQATGEWIAILDGDDWIAPERLEVLIRKAEELSADMVADDLAYVRDYDSQPWTSFAKQNGGLYQGLTHINELFFVQEDSKYWFSDGVSPGFLKPIIRRSLIEEHGIRYKDYIRLGQDFFFFLECLMAGAKFYFCQDAHYFYRSRPDSLVTKSQVNRLLQAEMGLTEILKDERLNQSPALQQALESKLSNCRKKRQYEAVVAPLRKKQLAQAVVEMTKNPYFFVGIAKKLAAKTQQKPASQPQKSGTVAELL